MMEDIKKQSLDSITFYKSIINVELVPMSKVTSYFHRPRFKKGDVEYTRGILTGFRKKVKKVYTENLWRIETGYSYADVGIHEYASRNGLLVIDNELYYKPVVRIETTNKDNNRTIKFDCNDDAVKYMREIKEKCKLCENSLL